MQQQMQALMFQQQQQNGISSSLRGNNNILNAVDNPLKQNHHLNLPGSSPRKSPGPSPLSGSNSNLPLSLVTSSKHGSNNNKGGHGSTSSSSSRPSSANNLQLAVLFKDGVIPPHEPGALQKIKEGNYNRNRNDTCEFCGKVFMQSCSLRLKLVLLADLPHGLYPCGFRLSGVQFLCSS